LPPAVLKLLMRQAHGLPLLEFPLLLCRAEEALAIQETLATQVVLQVAELAGGVGILLDITTVVIHAITCIATLEAVAMGGLERLVRGFPGVLATLEMLAQLHLV